MPSWETTLDAAANALPSQVWLAFKRFSFNCWPKPISLALFLDQHGFRDRLCHGCSVPLGHLDLSHWPPGSNVVHNHHSSWLCPPHPGVGIAVGLREAFCIFLCSKMRKIPLCSRKMSAVGVGQCGGLLGGFNRSILLGFSISENALNFIFLFILFFFIIYFKESGTVNASAVWGYFP